MKKTFLILLCNLWLCNISFGESYFFKECKINDIVTGNYVINLQQNVIEVELRAENGQIQYFTDKIKIVEKDQIVSEKIKSQKGKDAYYQYFLNSKSKSVTKLQYKKEKGIDFDVFNLFSKRKSYCKNIKTDWNKRKIDEAKNKKEQKEIIKAQDQIRKEQSGLINCQSNDHQEWTNCKGNYKAETGHEYSGLFKEGKIIKGISLYPGGSKYVGEFKNYVPHGYGTFVWANGEKYFGMWKFGKADGDGTKIWKDGRKYLGDFKNDKLHGQGTLFYINGKKYVGGFIDGKRHGEGTFTFSDGSAYIGKFIAGKEQGIGVCVSTDGLSVKCKNKKETQTKNFSGKDIRKISIVAKKWLRMSHYSNNIKKAKKVKDKLLADFNAEAFQLCSPKSNYKILDKKIEVLEIDETPAYGLEPKVQLVVNGVVECI